MDESYRIALVSIAARYRRESDSARHLNHYLIVACFTLLLTLLYVCMQRNPLPLAKPCPSPGVMQLDPTTVRATGSDAQWL
jgi:hypothetical protein